MNSCECKALQKPKTLEEVNEELEEVNEELEEELRRVDARLITTKCIAAIFGVQWVILLIFNI